MNEFENLKGGRSQTSKGQESDDQRRYGDILGHSYPFPLRHARMPVEDRAAQFASFAALNGYEEAVEEEARLTEREIDLDDSVREMINQTLVEAEEQLMRGETVWLSVTWFQPDVHKDGGAYRTAAGRLKKIDYYRQVLWLAEIKSGNQPGLENIGGEIAVNFPQICRVELIEEEVEKYYMAAQVAEGSRRPDRQKGNIVVYG
ncbi:MAG: hypothetical protein ACLSH1_07805 [Clostridia bacterium]